MSWKTAPTASWQKHPSASVFSLQPTSLCHLRADGCSVLWPHTSLPQSLSSLTRSEQVHQLSEPHVWAHQNWRATRKKAVLWPVMERSEITLSDRTHAARWSCGSTRHCCGIDLLLLLLLAQLLFQICLEYVLLPGLKDLSDQPRLNDFSPFLVLRRWQWLDAILIVKVLWAHHEGKIKIFILLAISIVWATNIL